MRRGCEAVLFWSGFEHFTHAGEDIDMRYEMFSLAAHSLNSLRGLKTRNRRVLHGGAYSFIY